MHCDTPSGKSNQMKIGSLGRGKNVRKMQHDKPMTPKTVCGKFFYNSSFKTQEQH